MLIPAATRGLIQERFADLMAQQMNRRSSARMAKDRLDDAARETGTYTPNPIVSGTSHLGRFAAMPLRSGGMGLAYARPSPAPAQINAYTGPNGERYAEMPLRSGGMAYAMSERRPTTARTGSLVPQAPGMPRQPQAATLSSQATNTPQALLNSLLGMASNTGRSSAVSDAAMGAKSAASTAYDAMIRNMSRMGVRPNSGRFRGSMRKWAADRAALEATARNNAASLARRDQFANQFSIYGAMRNEQNQRTDALARKAEMDAFMEALNSITSADIPAPTQRPTPLQTRGLLNPVNWR